MNVSISVLILLLDLDWSKTKQVCEYETLIWDVVGVFNKEVTDLGTSPASKD